MYVHLNVARPCFTMQTSTWDAHVVNAHSCVLTSSPYVLTGNCELQNKMAARKQQSVGCTQSHFYKTEENILPLNEPSQNMKFPMKFHNPLLIYNPERGLDNISLFFSPAETSYLGRIIYKRVICGKAGAKYRFPFTLRHSSFKRTFL